MKKLNIFYLFLGFLFMSCTSAQVSTDQAPQADLSSYHTYAFLPNKSDLSVKERDYDKSAVIKAMEEINDEMKARGYEIDLDEPELLVMAHIARRQEEDLEVESVDNTYTFDDPDFEIGVDDPYYYQGYESIQQINGDDVETVEFQKTAVVVDIIDANSHKIIWRGWAKDRGDVEDIKNNLQTYLDEIFEQYPVETQS